MRIHPLKRFISAFSLLASLGTASAQNSETPTDPAVAYDLAVAALDSANFAKGMEIVDGVIDRYSESGLQRFGPVFGHFYYLRGMLHIRQKQYAEAIEPMQTCYEKFSNAERQEGQPPNLFQVHALVQWASCLQAQEKYPDAIAKFEKALAEDPKREPRINRMGVQMNLGRCYMRTGEQAKGRAILDEVLGLKGLPDGAIQDAFTVLAWDGEDASPNDLMQVIQQHAGSLFGTAEDRDVMNPRLAGLAAKALQDKDPLMALTWYNLMTAPQEAIGRKLARKQQLLDRRGQVQGDVVKKFDEAIAKIDEEIVEKKAQHANTLLGMGAAHYQIGSFSSARAVYQQLIAHFPELEERALILHNLVVIGTKMSRWEEASTYGGQFFDEFPSHDLRPGIARILAEVVFLEEDFDLASKMAAEARTGLAVGSPEREGLDFVVAASLFQLEQLNEAESELEGFIKAYKTGERLESARFYLASLKVRKGDWAGAGPLLDLFADDYPDSQFRPSALHLSSLANLILGDPNAAFIRVNMLLGDHREAPEIPAAHNVKGDIQAARGSTYEQITQSYLRARQLVEEQNRGTPEVAAYALRQLIGTATRAAKWEDAVAYLDAFRERYADTPSASGATIQALDALVALEQIDKAREMLEGHVDDLREDPSAGLDQIFQAYTVFLRNEVGVTDALGFIEGFKATSETPQLQAWMLLGQIETHEASPVPDTAKIDELFGKLDQLYQEHGNKLTNYTLVRVARWKSAQNDQNASVAIYNFILQSRQDGGSAGYALIETAKLDFASGEADRIALARQKFDTVLTESTDRLLGEEAVLGIARILIADKNYAEAQPWWEEYIDQSDYTLARPEANYSYALCLDNRGQREEALVAYLNVYANFTAQFSWSVKATMRAAELLKGKGEILSSLKVLQDFLRQTADNAKDPEYISAKKTFLDWRGEYQKTK
ncbi:MAG: tetratricopeptide (TPR) repeat protein [Verrucomicrobiales bacterium]|jgi:tetratricopeptide (TPR) repeat protein